MSRPSESVGEGADFLQLTAAHAPARGVTTWLTGELRAELADFDTPYAQGRALDRSAAIGRLDPQLLTGAVQARLR